MDPVALSSASPSPAWSPVDWQVPEAAIAAFEALSGLRICLHDLHGGFSGAVDPRRSWHGGPLCSAIKQGPFAARCQRFEIDQLRPQLPELVAAGGRVHRCHAGLIEWVVPVVHAEAVVGILFAGQRHALDWNPDHQQPPSGVRLPQRVPAIDATHARHVLEGVRQLAARLAGWLTHGAAALPTAPRRSAQIHAFIDRRHVEPLRLADLATHLHLSPARAAHAVREATGRSWSALLTAARLRTACRLLRHSDAAVAAVAVQSGFGDQSHFQKIFRRELGLSPGAFRRDPEARLAGQGEGD